MHAEHVILYGQKHHCPSEIRFGGIVEPHEATRQVYESKPISFVQHGAGEAIGDGARLSKSSTPA
ncbi:MAG: hypothetical protein ACLPTZ_24430 [Beijerinckiaceae bacterium]